MKQVFAIFCAVILMPGLNVQAWTGGPFSNNNALESGDDGVYEAVATTINGMGIYRWAVRNKSTAPASATQTQGTSNIQSNVIFGGGLNGAISSNVWYYRGVTYFGPAFGTVSSTLGIVSVVGQGQSISESLSSQYQTSNSSGTNNTSNSGIDVQIVPPTDFVAGSVLVQSRPGISTTVNSSFIAKIKTDGPSKRFSGTGTVLFSGLTESVRIITFPLNQQTDITIDGTDAVSFPVGEELKFKVVGSQVSTQITQ